MVSVNKINTSMRVKPGLQGVWPNSHGRMMHTHQLLSRLGTCNAPKGQRSNTSTQWCSRYDTPKQIESIIYNWQRLSWPGYHPYLPVIIDWMFLLFSSDSRFYIKNVPLAIRKQIRKISCYSNNITKWLVLNQSYTLTRFKAHRKLMLDFLYHPICPIAWAEWDKLGLLPSTCHKCFILNMHMLYHCSMSDVKSTIKCSFRDMQITPHPTCKWSPLSFIHFCPFQFAQNKLYVQAIGPRQLS